MNKAELLKRVDHLISNGNEVLGTYRMDKYGSYVDNGKQIGFRTSTLSFIKSIYGESHIFYTDFKTAVGGTSRVSTLAGLNILNAIKNEIENNWIYSLTQLISAEIFSDFMEMADYLLQSKYKDPAAVMIGSILEEHLRMLCKHNNIEIMINKGDKIVPKKAEVLNADLVKAQVYTLLEQKNVTAWLDLRNKAAHGRYDEYKIENVELMYLGVLNFISSI